MKKTKSAVTVQAVVRTPLVDGDAERKAARMEQLEQEMRRIDHERFMLKRELESVVSEYDDLISS